MRKRQLPASFWEEPRAATGPLGASGAAFPTSASPSSSPSPLYERKKSPAGAESDPGARARARATAAAQRAQQERDFGPVKVLSAWSCCPFQYPRPQASSRAAYPPPLTAALGPLAAPYPPPLGLWRKNGACPAGGEAFGKPVGGGGGGAGQKVHRPVVWKPIPTKPPAAPAPPIFSVFGYL